MIASITASSIPRNVHGAPKARRKLILKVYRDWKSTVPAQRLWNRSLNDYIYIDGLSATETSKWASLSYWSTLAVLYLDYIIRYAEKDGPLCEPKKNQNQKNFWKIQPMKCYLQEVGWVKLTVGIYAKSGRKLQYCITKIRK